MVETTEELIKAMIQKNSKDKPINIKYAERVDLLEKEFNNVKVSKIILIV